MTPAPADPPPTRAPAPPTRRPYDAPARRQRAAETRERILGAGSRLVHGYPSWDWRQLTFRAVAEEAGVSVRTVFRNFSTERELHRAVMRRLEEEAGISYEDLSVDDLPEVTTRMFEAFQSFAASRQRIEPSGGEVREEAHRRASALLRALEPVTGDWSEPDRVLAAAVIDVLWSPAALERLTTDWDLDPEPAVRSLRWAIEVLVREARTAPGLLPAPSSSSPRDA